MSGSKDAPIDMTGFVKVESNSPNAPSPEITIRRSGDLGLNKTAVERMGDPPNVALYFNPETRVIAMEPAPEGAPGTYPIRRTPGSNAFSIAGKHFTSTFEISVDRAERYRAEEQDNWLFIDLKQETRYYPRKRPHKTVGKAEVEDRGRS